MTRTENLKRWPRGPPHDFFSEKPEVAGQRWLSLHKTNEDGFTAAIHGVLQKAKARAIREIEEARAVPSTFFFPSIAKDLMIEANKQILQASVVAARSSVLMLQDRGNLVRKNEIPDHIILAIQRMIEESYNQDYWEQVSKSIRLRLQSIIDTAIQEGTPDRKVAEVIEADQSNLFGPVRARRIARTEVTTALNSGHWAATQAAMTMTGTGIIGRSWLDVGDQDTRPEHLEASGQVAMGTTPFVVGGENARFPGDPNLSAWNRINCRCTTLDVFDDSF